MKRLIVFLALAAALIALGIVFDWGTWFSSGEFSIWLTAIREEHFALAALAYMTFTIIGCVVLALPGVIFALVAGAVFGPLWGTLLCWVSATVGAILSFFVGRYFLADALAPKIEKVPQLKSLLFDNTDKSDMYILALTRLIPLFPYNLQNFAYGITNIRPSSYALYSALFMLPGTAACTIAAAGIFGNENQVAMIVLACVLIAATLAAAYLLKKRAGI